MAFLLKCDVGLFCAKDKKIDEQLSTISFPTMLEPKKFPVARLAQRLSLLGITVNCVNEFLSQFFKAK